MPGRQLVDLGEQRFSVEITGAGVQKVVKRRWVDAAMDAGDGQQRLHLRGKGQVLAIVMIIQRFDAEGVTREEEGACTGIPDRQRPHPDKARETVRAPLLIGRENDFGIRSGMKVMTERGQFRAQFQIIVDFAVENNPALPIHAAQRFMSLGERPG